MARPSTRCRQSGTSLVELLIGMTLGLLVVGSALVVFVVQLRESRDLVAQGRLMQDLRAASDLMARDLRRAGYWGDASAAVRITQPAASAPATAMANPYAAVDTSARPATGVSFRYSRDAVENDRVDDNEVFGFRLRNGVIEMQLGRGRWQAMTDPGTLQVTRFEVTPIVDEIDLTASCSKPCPADEAGCGPRQRLRSAVVTLTARGVTQAAIERTASSRVRLRNDEITGACPT